MKYRGRHWKRQCAKIDCTSEIVSVSVSIDLSVSHILLYEVNVHASFFVKS